MTSKEKYLQMVEEKTSSTIDYINERIYKRKIEDLAGFFRWFQFNSHKLTNIRPEKLAEIYLDNKNNKSLNYENR